MVYFGSDYKNLYALNATTGNKIWNHTLNSTVYSSPCIDGTTVYVGCSDGKVYALDTEMGSELWMHQTGRSVKYSIFQQPGVRTCPAVANNIVYISASDGYLYALSALNGDELWYFQTNGIWFESSPAIAGGVVYTQCSGIATYENGFYALDASNGTVIQTYPMGGISSPAIVDGVVYVGDNDGVVYAFPAVSPSPTIPESPLIAILMISAITFIVMILLMRKPHKL